jgi:hypothetical protein
MRLKVSIKDKLLRGEIVTVKTLSDYLMYLERKVDRLKYAVIALFLAVVCLALISCHAEYSRKQKHYILYSDSLPGQRKLIHAMDRTSFEEYTFIVKNKKRK